MHTVKIQEITILGVNLVVQNYNRLTNDEAV